MIRLAATLLAAVACSGGPPSAPDCHGDPIYGARVQAEWCLPPVQIWIREHALFDGPDAGACSYVAYPNADECTPLIELFASCALADGYSFAQYQVSVDYAAGAYLWDGWVRVPSGAGTCRQSGGGMLVVVR